MKALIGTAKNFQLFCFKDSIHSVLLCISQFGHKIYLALFQQVHTKRSTTLLITKITHLILEHGTAKGPDSSEDEVELVQLFVAVWRCILRHQESLKEVTQHLDHGDVYQWSDLLESVVETDLEQLNSDQPGHWSKWMINYL